MTPYRERHLAGEYTAAKTGDDLKELTVAELREQAKKAGVPTSGTKDELLYRLNNEAA